jgi:hypothetical protein
MTLYRQVAKFLIFSFASPSVYFLIFAQLQLLNLAHNELSVIHSSIGARRLIIRTMRILPAATIFDAFTQAAACH